MTLSPYHPLPSLLLLTAILAAACTVPSASAGPEPRAEILVIDAGGPIPLARFPRKHPRLLLKLPRESRLDYRRDSDCAFWARPCSCPPCGEVWREVLNRKEIAKLDDTWARRRCARPVCTSCEGILLGTKPICHAGQCAAE